MNSFEEFGTPLRGGRVQLSRLLVQFAQIAPAEKPAFWSLYEE